MLTVGKFAFNRARTRHPSTGISPGKCSRVLPAFFSFLFSFFSFNSFFIGHTHSSGGRRDARSRAKKKKNEYRVSRARGERVSRRQASACIFFRLTVRHPAMVAVFAVAQMTSPGRKGLAGTAVDRTSDGLEPQDGDIDTLEGNEIASNWKNRAKRSS